MPAEQAFEERLSLGGAVREQQQPSALDLRRELLAGDLRQPLQRGLGVSIVPLVARAMLPSVSAPASP